MPNPQLPFLGVHFTKKIGSDEIWSGPNSVLAFSREGYSFKDVNWKDIKDTVNHPYFIFIFPLLNNLLTILRAEDFIKCC